MSEAPVRLCCRNRHYGVRCPDGLVMCELCFDRFTDDQLMRDVDDSSKRWNICLTCGRQENVSLLFLVMAGGFKRSPRPPANGERQSA